MFHFRTGAKALSGLVTLAAIELARLRERLLYCTLNQQIVARLVTGVEALRLSTSSEPTLVLKHLTPCTVQLTVLTEQYNCPYLDRLS